MIALPLVNEPRFMRFRTSLSPLPSPEGGADLPPGTQEGVGASGLSASVAPAPESTSPAPRRSTRRRGAAQGSGPPSVESAGPPLSPVAVSRRVRELSNTDVVSASTPSGTRKRARLDPSEEVSSAVTYFIGKPRPRGKRAPIQQRSDAPRAPPLRASTSGGTTSSPLGLELRGLSLDSPASTPASGATPVHPSPSSITDPRRLRSLVSAEWSAIVESVNRIGLATAEIRDAARREEALTQRPFGAELLGGREDVGWVLPGGVSSVADIPRVAALVEAAIRTALASGSGDAEMADA